ncbi:glutathione S-transferase [Metarhizobium album]|uniref:Glutathione S-transferase n=1 Tax=Metarhizobium album TaxID=2182425 RepID=A0A2U2DL29_9HYPH|nr:glutaredoxin domain-containing protein [Rhizobium album]PWE54008.1 glutathione S-transferase [Rhizobium album]
MTQDFRPVVYLKNGCPFCFKLRVALLEMGSIDEVEIRTFSSGTPEEAAIRERLSGRVEKVSFPVVEISPDEFRTESDELIAHFAGQKQIDPSTLPTLQAYIDGPFAKLQQLFRENRDLKKEVSA